MTPHSQPFPRGQGDTGASAARGSRRAKGGTFAGRSASMLFALAQALVPAGLHAGEDPGADFASALRRTLQVERAGPQRFSVEQRMRHYGVTALSVAIVDDCRIVATRGFGRTYPGGPAVDEHTLFQAGSISKAVASAGAMRLVEMGVLALDDDIGHVLGDADIPRPAALGRPGLTLRQLLSHSAGLGVAGFKGYPPQARLPDLRDIIEGRPPANTDPIRIEVMPGTQWRYSGGGFVLLQLMMERAGARPFHELMQRRVFAPAGMAASSYLPPRGERAARAAQGTRADGGAIAGGWMRYPEQAAAGLWTTPADLARFAIALVRSLRGEHRSLLGREAAKAMLEQQIGHWGLGVDLAPQGQPRRFGHTGAPVGYRSLWLMHPDGCQGATIMTNADEGMALAYEVARAIADQHAWPDRMPSAAVADIPTSAAIAHRFVGHYRLRDFPGEHFEIIRRRDGGLAWARSRHGQRDLVAIGSERLVSPDNGMQLSALDEEPVSGRALHLQLRFSAGVNIAERAAAEAAAPPQPLESRETPASVPADTSVSTPQPSLPSRAQPISRPAQSGHGASHPPRNTP